MKAKIAVDAKVKEKPSMLVKDDFVICKQKTLNFKVKHNARIYDFPKDFTVLSECPRTAEDPDTPQLSEIYRGVGSLATDNRYLIPDVFVIKVMADAQDTVRAVFTSHEQRVPVAFIPAAHGSYTRIDAGIWLALSKGGTLHTVRDSLGSGLTEITKPGLCPEALHDLDLSPMMKTYMQEFKEGKQALYHVGCLAFNLAELCAKYNDSSIVFPNAATLIAAVEKLLAMREAKNAGSVDDFETAVETIIMCNKGHALVINGTSILYEVRFSANDAELAYVNNRKISKDDLSEVIRHVLCCPSINDMPGNEAYRVYLEEVSRISLKFHKAMTNGIEFTIPAHWLLKGAVPATKDKPAGSAIRIPGVVGSHGDSDEDKAVKMKLKIDKIVGKKACFELFGVTYGITNLDGFTSMAFSRSEHTCRKALKRNNPNKLHLLTGMKERPKWYCLGLKLMAMECHLDKPMLDGLKPVKRTISEYAYNEAVHRYEDMTRIVDCYAPDQHNLEILTAWSDKISEACKLQMSDASEVLARSYELFKEILSDTGAVEVCNEGTYEYHVTGRSGTRYVVDEASARVYLNDGQTKASRQHICIVKGNGGKIAGYDYLGSVIAALSDDSYIAQHVHTIASVLKNKEKVAKD